MTPKDKARELVLKFYPEVRWKLGQEDCIKRAKNCALIAVDEILSIKLLWYQKDTKDLQYWNEVEQEIELL
jgi:hypothetical protein